MPDRALDEAGVWARFADRWERFQESYVPHREDMLGIIVDCLVGAETRDGSRVIDLCCGPGSITRRLLPRMPSADVVAVDVDPWLLEMGRRIVGDDARVTWIETDVRDRAWTGAIPPGPYQAVAVATAMHWFEVGQVDDLYADIATMLAPGGLFLSADMAITGTEGAQRLSRYLSTGWQARQVDAGGVRWERFWSEAEAEPAFEAIMLRRNVGPKPPRVAGAIESHWESLRRAGFREVGELWRFLDTAVLVAIR